MNVSRLRAHHRELISNQLADAFEQSGIEYTCGRIVIEFVEIHVTDEQIELTAMSQRRIANMVWRLVQNRWQSRQ